MTAQEAIMIIQAIPEKIWNQMDRSEEEAIKIAVEALEKQIPKKPLFGTMPRDTAYHCGSCKNFISYYDTRIYEYCHNCGQKLDWSEEEGDLNAN